MIHPVETRLLFSVASLAIALLGGVAFAQERVELDEGSEEALPFRSVREGPSIDSINGFVANRGQWDSEVLYFARAGGIEATLTRDALVFRPAPPDPRTGRPWLPPVVLRLPHPVATEGEGALPTMHHFILASGSASHVPGFERVVYRDVAPGIDLVVRKNSRGDEFAYDVHVAPGARLEDLVIRVEGAAALGAAGPTLLAMQTGSVRVDHRIGASWQEDLVTQEREPVDAAFRVVDAVENELSFGFVVEGRDPTRSLVVDPSLEWGTYLGGASSENMEEMAVDAEGGVYLACQTGPNTPTTPGAFQTTPTGSSEAWLAKLSADGSQLEWGTFLGGSASEQEPSVGIAPDGGVLVAGLTWSADFPTTLGTLQPNFAGIATKNDLFAAKLSPDGSTLVWSTFYGGPDYEIQVSLGVFPNGDVLLAGEPMSASPPSTVGAFDTHFDVGDNLFARISSDGTSLIYQTYFPAGRILDLTIDEDGDIVFGGDVSPLDNDPPIPATPGALKTSNPTQKADGFVAKLTGDGTTLVWATYIGSDTHDDYIWGLAVDAAGAIYVVGQTFALDFPTTSGAFSPTYNGEQNFVAKLLPSASELVWSTYFGATCCGGGSRVTDIVVDRAGNACIVGSANEAVLPVTPDAFQMNYIGPFPHGDVFLTKIDAFGESLIYSTWYSGTGSDMFSKLVLAPDQSPIIGFRSTAADVPVTTGAYDTTYDSSFDAVVAKFHLPPLPWQVKAGGKVGSPDIPNLAGGGWLVPGTPARLSVRGAPPQASAFLIAGFTEIDAPALGGTLVPSPDIVLPLVTNSNGSIDLAFPWPNVTPGIRTCLQLWVADPGALFGWSASNALRMTSQASVPQ